MYRGEQVSSIYHSGIIMIVIKEENNDWMIIPEEYVLMPNTGVKDIHKIEVYQEDIIKFRTSQTQHFKGIVKWDDCSFFTSVFYQSQDPFGTMTESREHYWLKGNYQDYRFSSDLFDIEILGNIFENPELDEGRK